MKIKMNSILNNGIAMRTLIWLHHNQHSNKNYALRIIKEIDCTYSAFIKNIEMLSKLDFLKYEKKEGRTRSIRLTDKGKILAKKLLELKQKLL